MPRRTVQCINCGKQRRCLLIQVHVPIPIGSQEHNDIDNTFTRIKDWQVEESARVAICRGCLRDPLCPLARYLDEASK